MALSRVPWDAWRTRGDIDAVVQLRLQRLLRDSLSIDLKHQLLASPNEIVGHEALVGPPAQHSNEVGAVAGISPLVQTE